MIVDTGAYVLSLILVLIGCITRDFVIPLFVWRKHLKGRSYSYCFWFSLITQAAIQINLVIILGIFNILNGFTFLGFNILIYLLIIWNYSDKKFLARLKRFIYELWDAYKKERFIRYLIHLIKRGLKNLLRKIYHCPIWISLKKHWLEILFLVGILIYNIWFLTRNVMLYHCYQFSDIPVHTSWVHQLEQGNLYSDGIYPFGMHIMIYFVRQVFGFNLREIMLYAGAYQFLILVIGIYLLAKQIFIGKYLPIAAILILSLMLNQGRYAASLPQEAGMYAVVAIAYFMIRYLHGDRDKFIIESDTRLRSFFRINSYINRRYISSELLLLMLSVSLVISYHYYTAIAAIFLVIAIGLAYFPKIFKKQYFIPLFYSGIMGALIAIIPIGLCLSKGMRFQASTDWAKSVMSGKEWRGEEADYQKKLALALGNDEGDIDESNNHIKDQVNTGTKVKDSISSGMSIKEFINYYKDSIYEFGSNSIYGPKPTTLMFVCMIIGFISALIMQLSKRNRVYGYDYIALIIMMLFYLTLGASRDFGIPEIIEVARISSFSQPFIGLIYMLPVDFAFRILNTRRNALYQFFLKSLSLAICAICVFIIFNEGWYHNYFDVNQAYYNEAEYVLRHIKKSYKKNSYTIVSPTDEYYDVVDHGRHTELSQFVNMIDKNEDKFEFTTDYVFFFIEKLVLQDYNYGRVKVDLEYAYKDFVYIGDIQDYYFQRAVIESKAYYWAKKFHEMYPRNFKIYFEDDIYIVYLMEQNTYFPYDLQIDYLEDYRIPSGA